MSGAQSASRGLLALRRPSLGVSSLNLPRSFGIGALFGLALVASTSFAQTADTAQSIYIGAQADLVSRSVRTKIDRRFARRVVRSESSLAGVYAPLAAKAREIQASCGASVISGVRHTRVRGTGRWSLHASGHAVDMRGNPSCIYAHLRGWQGGYSTDYGRVEHVHISLGGREDGLRFAHGGGRRRTRLAGR